MNIELEPHELQAWDRYAAAVLGGWWCADIDSLPRNKPAALCAAEAADYLIEERRKREPQE